LGEVLSKQCGFIGPFEIQLTIAGVDFVEEPKMVGDCLSNLAIGRSCQHDTATNSFFLPNKIKDFLPIGKISGVELDSVS
jgi:hypothetical protein